MPDFPGWVQVGAAAVLPLNDGLIPGPGLTAEQIPVNAFLVRSMGRLILVDSGLGEKWLDDEPDLVRSAGSIVDGLRRVNIGSEDIEIVINTHLHVDHAGGNTCFAHKRLAIAAFPQARYIVQAAEWRFARSPGQWSYLFRMDDFQPLADSGHLQLIDGSIDVTPEVRCVPSPGHTPGHQIVEVISEGRAAVLVGDAIQSDDLLLHPTAESAQDVDPLMAKNARVSMLQWACEREAWIGMAHAGETLRRIETISHDHGTGYA